MEISLRQEANAVVGSLKGRLDAVSAPEFDSWFAARLQAGEHRLVLDLSGLEYISSAGLRSLLASAKQIKAVQGSVVLSGLAGTVEEVFRMSGFLTIFKVTATPEEALTALA